MASMDPLETQRLLGSVSLRSHLPKKPSMDKILEKYRTVTA